MADNYIYWCASKPGVEDDIGFEDEMPVEEGEQSLLEKGKARESMYVSLVEGKSTSRCILLSMYLLISIRIPEMVKTVLDYECFLFSNDELAFFKAYSQLSCPSFDYIRREVSNNHYHLDKARYLLARLLVRKTGKWYRLSQLKYVSELGEDGILLAIEELCGKLGSEMKDSPPSSLQCSPKLRRPLALNQRNEDTIDLISDEETTNTNEQLRARSLSAQPNEASASQSTNRNTLDYYAEDENRASLQELLKCLTVEELKAIARTLKLPNGLTTVSSDIPSR